MLKSKSSLGACGGTSVGAIFECLEKRQLFAAGDPDALFGGGDGRTTVDFPGDTNIDWGTAVAIQPDGKIIIAGEYRSALTANDSKVALARLNRNGTLDTTFGGGDGMVVQDVVFASPKDVATSVALQSNGKIVVGGYASSGSELHFMVARFNTDGSFDTSFGFGGSNSSVDFNPAGLNNDIAYGMAVDNADRIVLCGYSGPPTGVSNFDFAVARFTANGLPDSTFSGDGRMTRDFGVVYESANAVAIRGSDIYVAGSAGPTQSPDIAVMRLDSGGNYIASRTDNLGAWDAAYAITIDRTGHIVVGGSTNAVSASQDFAILRYHADLSLDTSFSGDGKLIATMGLGTDRIFALTVQPDEKIVAAGELWVDRPTRDDTDFIVARFNNDGSADWGFGPHGMRTTDFSYGNDSARGVAIDDDGNVVLAGSALIGPDDDFAVARYQGGQYNHLGLPFGVLQNIQMEDYDRGGEGVSYHDIDWANYGGVYRAGSVDVYPAAGGRVIGFAMPGEWVEYTIDVAQTGAYDFQMHGGSYGNTARFHLEVDGVNVTGLLTPHDILSNSNYGTTTKTGISLAAGQHVMRVVFDQASTTWGIVGEFDWMRFTDATPPTLASSEFDFETGHAMSLTLSEDIHSYNLDSAHMQLIRSIDGGVSVITPSCTVDPDPSGDPRRLRIRWNEPLADGDYILRILPNSVYDEAGNGNPMIYADSFFVLGADANRDRTVNSEDFNALAGNFGQAGRWFSQGDFNYDGVVDSNDFNILAAKFGTTLPSASSMSRSPFSNVPIAETDSASDPLQDLLT